MNLNQICILLPGHGWDELVADNLIDEPAAFLSAMTGPWHPLILDALGTLPRFQPIFDLHGELRNHLIVVTPMATDGMSSLALDPSNLVAHVGGANRSEFCRTLLDHLGLPTPTGFDDTVVSEFWALAYAYLQIKLLTYRVHYSSGLDETQFADRVVTAARAAVAGDSAVMDEALDSSYRMLKAERWNYYPVDAYMLETAVLGGSAHTSDITFDFEGGRPFSLLVTGTNLGKLSALRPELCDAVQGAVRDGQVSLLGGELDEPPWFLMSCESVLESLCAGRRRFIEHLGQAPTVFARRRFGLSPLILQALVQLDYVGVVNSVLDSGRHPSCQQPRARLVLPNGASIKALGKLPIAVHDAAAMSKLGSKMGSSMEHDYLATLALARWAHERPPWWEDLNAGLRRSKAIGKPITIDGYFDVDCHQIHEEPFAADKLLSPHLPEATARAASQPVSRWVDLTLAQAACEEARNLEAFAAALGVVTGLVEPLQATSESLVARQANAASLRESAESLRLRAATAFSQGIVGPSAASAPDSVPQPPEGMMLINPLGFTRRVHFRAPQTLLRPPSAVAWHQRPGQTEGVVETGPFGYVFLQSIEEESSRHNPSTDPPHPNRTTEAAPIGKELCLTNEHIAVHAHSDTGGIRAVYDFKTRGNRVSQRLECRWPDRYGFAESTTSCSSSALTHNSEVSASITSQGQLLVDNQLLGEFDQTITLVEGQRRITVEVDLRPAARVDGDPWKNYVCSTLALPDEAMPCYRAVNWQRAEIKDSSARQRLESCQYLDWAGTQRRTTLLSGGLPFHVRRDKFADTILCVQGECARTFRLGIAIDPADALRESLDFSCPPLLLPAPRPPTAGSGWLMHVDARHVAITSVQPITDGDGAMEGLALRLLESHGGAGPVTVRLFRPITSAQKCNFNGQPLCDCELLDGAARLHVKAHEWTQVELRW